MRRIVATSMFLAMGTLLLTGCGPQQGASSSRYAPYDEESNPYCGALGSCEPLHTEPYRLVPGF